MVPTAVEVVGRVGIAEEAGEPKAQIPPVDRYDDVASSVITSWSGARASRPWPSTGSSIRPCSLPRLQRLKGVRM
jgi:hypothetical protein